MSRLLTIPISTTEVLSPAQRKFNRLQQQIGQGRERLKAWDQAWPGFTQSFNASVLPLRRQAEQFRRETALHLDHWLSENGWAQGERSSLESMVCELSREAIEEHDLDAGQRAWWKDLHDRHAAIGFDAENAHHMTVLKRMMERETGLDLGDVDFDNEADLMQHVRQRLQAQRDAAGDDADEVPPLKPKKLSAAQRKRQAEREAVAAQAQQSLRTVFRKLASSLHPDRASDAADAVRRTELMQRANAAYAANDLLALLTLQLEIEQIDAAHLRGASEAQLKHFNAVLQEQLDELESELALKERAFCAEFGLRPRQTLNPGKLAPVLANAVADMKAVAYAAKRDLACVTTRDGTRRWIKKLKAEMRAEFA
jgi:hypothetical protein